MRRLKKFVKPIECLNSWMRYLLFRSCWLKKKEVNTNSLWRMKHLYACYATSKTLLDPIFSFLKPSRIFMVSFWTSSKEIFIKIWLLWIVIQYVLPVYCLELDVSQNIRSKFASCRVRTESAVFFHNVLESRFIQYIAW